MLDKVKRFKDRVDEFLFLHDGIRFSLTIVPLFFTAALMSYTEIGMKHLQGIEAKQNRQMQQQIQEMIQAKNQAKNMESILKIQGATKEVDNAIWKRR